MTNDSKTSVQDALDRLTRLMAADDWLDDLNPTQKAALAYLARANRFSRAPSQVADYLAATRGTVSQTLKALARKGFVEPMVSPSDKRWVSYEMTDKGCAALNQATATENAIAKLSDASMAGLENGLQNLLKELLKNRDNKAFGICRDCTYHQKISSGGHCRLLNEPLTKPDADLICHEFAA